MYLNRILLIGNLGHDPEFRYLPSGKPVTTFRIAVTRRFKSDGELKVECEWFSTVCFGRLAEIAAEILKKGRSVFVEGRVCTRSWTDREGAKHYKTEVVAEGIQLVGKRDSVSTEQDLAPEK